MTTTVDTYFSVLFLSLLYTQVFYICVIILYFFNNYGFFYLQILIIKSCKIKLSNFYNFARHSRNSADLPIHSTIAQPRKAAFYMRAMWLATGSLTAWVGRKFPFIFTCTFCIIIITPWRMAVFYNLFAAILNCCVTIGANNGALWAISAFTCFAERVDRRSKNKNAIVFYLHNLQVWIFW